MLFGKYTIRLAFLTDAELPRYKGSTIRGAFGHALKRVTCALRREDCGSCLLADTCPYCLIFETPPSRHGPRGPTPSHPFVIEPPETTSEYFHPGDPLELRLLLFGAANDLLPYFVYAFEQLGEVGLGRGIRGHRGRVRLESVRCGDETIYSQADRTLRRVKPVRLDLTDLDGLAGPVDRIALQLVTPLRLKRQNKMQADLPFHVLVRACFRRIADLARHADEPEPGLDYQGLVKRAEHIRITHHALKWFDWRRYSNRQQNEMFLGGIVGSVTYQGPLSEYFRLIRFAETVHLGKATTFGLGKVRIIDTHA